MEVDVADGRTTLVENWTKEKYKYSISDYVNMSILIRPYFKYTIYSKVKTSLQSSNHNHHPLRPVCFQLTNQKQKFNEYNSLPLNGSYPENLL